MINISEMIINLNMNYKFYVRYHSGDIVDTVFMRFNLFGKDIKIF